MEHNWDTQSGQGHDSDHTENQKQDQNNNGNIGREESAGANEINQNQNENGQFGTTAEKGSGALDEQPQAYTDNDGLAREREIGQEGYNETENSGTYGRSQREIDTNWAQGSEGSPGKGYQDDMTSGRNTSQSEYTGSSDEQGLTDKYEGQPGNFADRNADQQYQSPDFLKDDEIDDDDRTRDELI
jgi:hypothetical protein